jgi:hypothetical protein
MCKPDITVRGTRYPSIEAALEHLPLSDEDLAISIGKTYLTVPEAEVERLKEAGVPFTIHGGRRSQSPKPPTPGAPHAVEIIDNLMTVFDAEGHGVACHVLIDPQAAKAQLKTWRSRFAFDYFGALADLARYFESL